MSRLPLKLAGEVINPGETRLLSIPAARLYTDTPIDLPVEVIHSRKPGPVLLVCAAIHGDEINGIEICRRIVGKRLLRRLSGTLLIVPIVNMFGFIQQSRYLPDRRDLNRCFPGSPRGPLGNRLANLIHTELLSHCTHVIDLHTGAIHRKNLSQIRGDLDDPAALGMAEAFGAPIFMDAKVRDGSLRAAAAELGIPVILYEAGEALRFDEPAIKAGVRGIMSVMRHLGMLPARTDQTPRKLVPVKASRSYWLRAERDGIVISKIKLGQRVKEGQILAYLASPFGGPEKPLKSRSDGIVIAASQIPLVNEGEALFHIAEFTTLRKATDSVEAFQEQFDDQPEPEAFTQPL